MFFLWAECRYFPVAPPVINAHKECKIEAFSAVTMKIVVLWDIETQFVPHSRYITSPLQGTAS
jgi:hypothetical protein